MGDWRKIVDEREKYAAYLCSPEWGRLRAAVHERAKGICERCNRAAIDAVHHLTYQRKYSELLTDLQGICNPCHEFTHGRSKTDPAAEKPPLMICGKEIKSIYLLEDVNWEEPADSLCGFVAPVCSFRPSKEWLIKIREAVLQPSWNGHFWGGIIGGLLLPDGRSLNYRGPFCKAITKTSWEACAVRTLGAPLATDDWDERSADVEAANAKDAISKSEMVVAVITESPSARLCMELGFASGIGIPVFGLILDDKFDDAILHYCSNFANAKGMTPYNAWCFFWNEPRYLCI